MELSNIILRVYTPLRSILTSLNISFVHVIDVLHSIFVNTKNNNSNMFSLINR